MADGIRDLMEAVDRDPYFERTPIPRERDPWMPSVGYDNRLLAEILKGDPRFRGTNVGSNPEGYLDPRYESGLTRYALGIGNSRGATGEYYSKYDPHRNQGGRLWASTISDDPASFLRTLTHENIHGNTFEGPAREEASKSTFYHSPYLSRELMEMEHEKLPTSLTKAERKSAFGENYEPVAWVGATEAMLPSGQMPIQEEMNRRGLGALYAHMTTAGPVATRLPPSILQRLQDYMSGESSEEPYELRGNEVEKARKRK